jgi:predicted RND superfamily exporter protein
MLGWLGIPLSGTTSIVGCLALGLAVDDTAHVLGHQAPGRSLREVYDRVSRPMALTSLLLGLGFAAFLLSGFRSVALLGGAVATTLAAAYAFDVLVLPSLLVLCGHPAGDADAEREAA